MVDRPTPTVARSAILVIDHGSRAAEANESLGRMAELVRARLPAGSLVGIAHMEIAAPTVAEGVAALVAAGATEVVVVPYFLAPGRHSRADIPRLVDEARAAHPAVAFAITEPLGPHPLLADLVVARARPGRDDDPVAR
jgi:sirohydrochlorin ferrochelatase